MAADGVWYVTGGTHHSVVIEMKDHLVVVEGPLNDDRALAVIAEARSLVPGKPIRYLVVSHHHFDHAGGLRAFAGEGVTIIAHDVSRPGSSSASSRHRRRSAPTVSPETGERPTVEGMRGRRGAHRRHADRRGASPRRQPAHRRPADGVPAEVEAPGRSRRLFAAAAECGADGPPSPFTVAFARRSRSCAWRSTRSCRSTAASFRSASCRRLPATATEMSHRA